MNVLLAQPRGFCAGVVRAIETVERALEVHGPPVYVVHEIVHNRHVVEDLRARGAVFVDSVEDVPEGAVAVFSAHGVPAQTQALARSRNCIVVDATCPLVEKVHRRIRRHLDAGREVVLVGHAGHPEVVGHLGQAARGARKPPVHLVSTVEDVEALSVRNPEHLAYATQTTLSLDETREVIRALERRFPGIRGPALEDICYATQNRQNAVRDLAPRVELLLVVGSANSSNSNRLRESGERAGLTAHRVDGPDEVDPAWLAGVRSVGVTAGASAPEHLVQGVVRRLRELGAESVLEMEGEPEATVFSLPELSPAGLVGPRQAR